jgi:cytochrome c
MKLIRTITMLVLMQAAAASAHAEGLGRAQQGRTVAERNCAECHAVVKGPARSPNPEAPAFTKIASTSGITTIALTAAMQTSHRTMPNIMLDGDELRDVIAYILSLRESE